VNAKRTIQAGLVALMAASATACGQGALPAEAGPAKARAGTEAAAASSEGRIELEKTAYTVKTWRIDGSHLVSARGKLVYRGRPVGNAVLRSDAGGRLIRTESDGSFGMLVDLSLPVHARLRVVSAEEASVAGRPVGKKEAEALLAASSAFQVFHPIEVAGTEPSKTEPGKVNVHARIAKGEGNAVSFFHIDKFRIAGRVADADGKPVQGAIVWIDRDKGEGFAKSTPTDRDGNYEMFYFPEEEDTNLTVIVGTRRYSLPEGKVFDLPRRTSVDIRIRLPREGTTIEDKPPMLVCETSKGATYAGLLAGLDVPPDVEYTVTVPDEEGRFELTVPADAWAKRPPFFETRLTKFVGREKVLKGGDALPAGFVQPRERDPRVAATEAAKP